MAECTSNSKIPMKTIQLFIASCVPNGGIYSYTLSENKLQLSGYFECDRPMYLELQGNKLNVLLREPFLSTKNSALQTCIISTSGDVAETQERISTEGIVACHLCTFQDYIYATNYLSGSVFCSTGTMDTHTGCGSNPIRQDSPHPHYISPSPDSKYLLSTDLGLDAVFVYDKELVAREIAYVPNGHGARHLAFSQDGKYVFCANELASTVSVFKYDDGHLEIKQTVPALFKENLSSTIAAIRVKGDYVYVSNRGDDSISCLKWDGTELELVSVTSCGGQSPRDFIIVENLLICANENSNSVTFFAVSGKDLIDCKMCLEIQKPVCVVASVAL